MATQKTRELNIQQPLANIEQDSLSKAINSTNTNTIQKLHSFSHLCYLEMSIHTIQSTHPSPPQAPPINLPKIIKIIENPTLITTYTSKTLLVTTTTPPHYNTPNTQQPLHLSTTTLITQTKQQATHLHN